MYVMGGSEVVVGKEEVIAKLKDDGDFDRLRLKIIRKLKDDENLRQHVASIVKQSAALNSDGAENMKPRQLSDAIFDEVGFGFSVQGRHPTNWVRMDSLWVDRG